MLSLDITPSQPVNFRAFYTSSKVLIPPFNITGMFNVCFIFFMI
jgi:hypothetical protein